MLRALCLLLQDIAIMSLICSVCCVVKEIREVSIGYIRFWLWSSNNKFCHMEWGLGICLFSELCVMVINGFWTLKSYAREMSLRRQYLIYLVVHL